MAVVVYVWKKQGQFIGHVSLRVGARYVSFWPADSAGKKDVLVKRSHEPEFIPDYETDFVNEGEREPEKVTLWNLNEIAMIKARNELERGGCRYNLLKMNCSSFAAALLEAGSGHKPSFVPTVHPREYIGNTKPGRKMAGSIVIARGPLQVWTPEQVLLYAHELLGRGPKK